jgi:hypothetical protein
MNAYEKDSNGRYHARAGMNFGVCASLAMLSADSLFAILDNNTD